MKFDNCLQLITTPSHSCHSNNILDAGITTIYTLYRNKEFYHMYIIIIKQKNKLHKQASVYSFKNS